MDLQTYRENSLQTWDRMAPGWEGRREWLLSFTGAINDWLVDQLAPQPGQRILDVAAGIGDLGLATAERVGPDGSVISTDFSAEMTEAARRNGESRGLSNVEYRVLDAERMDLGDDTVDGVLSRFGYMLMADPAAALSETRRVLKDGGTLAFAVWQAPERNPWAATPGMVMVERGHVPPPEPAAPGMFAMGARDRIVDLVTGAGFGEPRTEELTFDWRYRPGELWDTLNSLAGPLAAVIAQLPDDERERTREAIEQRMEGFRQGDDLVVPAAAWGVVAR
jgi:SAM-dependent methyltransferase